MSTSTSEVDDRSASAVAGDPAGGDRAAAIAATGDTTSGKVFVPSAYPGAAIFGSVLGLGLLGLAALGIHDLIVHVGWISGPEWTESVANWIASSTWQPWMWAVAVALVIIGLWLIWLALKPRRRTHVALGEYEVLWTRRGDVARRCSAAMFAVSGVEHATTVVGRRKAKVTVTANDAVGETELHARATEAVAALKKPPKIKIRTVSRHKKGASS